MESLFYRTAALLLGKERAAEMWARLRTEYFQAKVYFRIPKPPWWLRLYLRWPARKWQDEFFTVTFTLLGKMAGAGGALREPNSVSWKPL